MAQTNVNIRMDSDLKTQFEAFCTDMGMTMTTAFTRFLQKKCSTRISAFLLKSAPKYRTP